MSDRGPKQDPVVVPVPVPVPVPVVVPVTNYAVGGSVTGLPAGQSLVLTNQGGDALTVTANGSFTFGTSIAAGSSYLIAIQKQPDGQVCSLSSGSGGPVAANTTSVQVVCSTSSYTIGGSVAGLASGQSVVLLNNAGDPLTASANGAFTFAAPVASGGSYQVTVGTQPAGATCSPVNASNSGSVSSANITSVQIACTAVSYTIGGTLQGLASGAQIGLANNGSDPLTLTANGSFTFASPVSSGGSYKVTLTSSPTGQVCTLTGDTGNATSNVSSANVACSARDTSVVLHQRFVEVQLGSTDWNNWNSLSPNDTDTTPVSGQTMVQNMTKKLFASGLTDQYREILFILNTEQYPSGMPTGEFAFVRSDNVPGLGLPATYNDSAKFGANNGVLEGLAVLYKRNAIYGCNLAGAGANNCSEGPVLHELIHRYANWSVPTNYGGHWPTDGRYDSGSSKILGRLASVVNPYSQIELYLMGLLAATQINDPASLNAFNAIPASVGARSLGPTTESVLVVVLTQSTAPLSTTVGVSNNVASFENSVLIMTNDNFATDTTGQGDINNYYTQTGMRGHLTTFVPSP